MINVFVLDDSLTSSVGDTSVMVLIVLCLGVKILCCLHLMYVFIF